MESMEIDRNGFEIPSREECLQLIRHRPLGRLAIHTGALPAIVPVNFVLTDEGVILRTAPGTKLDQAIRNAVVAFEVDDYDALRHTGWSVNVVGIARELTDPVQIALAQHLPIAQWGPGDRTHFVCIGLDVVSGRRIVHAAPALT
jgi:nitroimidazol reductase NimA-like FMN-containing flavoprotein (pyridoxamine 5'-phosphate oxidase superfamily)